MGGEVLYRSILCVKKGGTVVCLPSSTKDDPKAIELAAQHGVTLIWPMMHTDGDEMKIIASLLEQKKLKITIDKIYTLDQIAWAHKAVETHGSRGKVIVRIN
jgi:NADPH:quinone reductase-like Zn-dependent oxidoreductase